MGKRATLQLWHYERRTKWALVDTGSMRKLRSIAIRKMTELYGADGFEENGIGRLIQRGLPGTPTLDMVRTDGKDDRQTNTWLNNKKSSVSLVK
jgi:hypothetical protein